jgi:hypothetical protein
MRKPDNPEIVLQPEGRFAIRDAGLICDSDRACQSGRDPTEDENQIKQARMRRKYRNARK